VLEPLQQTASMIETLGPLYIAGTVHVS
jgi:hypothetical protein